MKNNNHLQAIPAAVIAEAQAKIDEARTALAPYLLALTPEERQGLAKMGEKTLAFVEKAHDFAGKNPGLRPSFLDMTTYDVDFTDAHGLWTLLNTVQQLEETLTDTEMVAGSEAYQASLVFYKSVRMAAEADVPGAQAVYDELRTRFASNRRRSGTESESETVTETIKKKIERS